MLNKVTLYTGREFQPELPEIDDDEYAGIFFTGGVESTLVAKMMIEKYGVDRVVFIILTMNRYSNYASNQKKLSRVTGDFESRVTRLGGKHIVDMNTTDAEQCDELYQTRILVDMTRMKINREVGKCNHVFAGYSNIHQEHMTLLDDCEWEKGMMLREQVETWLDEDNRIDNYPEVKRFLREQKGALYFVTEAVSFSTVQDHYYNTIKPLNELTKGEAVELYKLYDIEDELQYTITCNEPKYSGYDHCGECKNCIQRQDGFTDAGMEDPTNYMA